jgi:hypothetical protein
MTFPEVTVMPDVVDYLVAQVKASPLIGQATPAVAVFDGPQLADTQLAGRQQMWVGWDPWGAGLAAMEAESEFANMDAGRSRDETGAITCAVQDTSGDTRMQAHRDAVKTLIGAVDLMLRGTPQNGGPGDTTMGGLVFWSQVSGPYAWYQRQETTTASVGCVFRITYFARLATS